jgi:hypothetical protein
MGNKHARAGGRIRNLSIGILVGFSLIGGIYYYFAPHPIRGPARLVDASEQMRILKGADTRSLTEKFPQLNPKVVSTGSSNTTDDRPAVTTAASISGRVLDKNSDTAVPNAVVTMTLTNNEVSSSQYSAKCDVDGRYQISQIIGSGEIVLFATASGYCPIQSDIDHIALGQVLNDVDFYLETSAGRIGGHVVNQERQPIPAALVEIISGPQGGGQLALTDEEGGFSIDIPADGEFVLRASKEGYGTERFTGILAGMEQVELILLQAAAIAGRITDQHANPKQGLNVVVTVEHLDTASDAGESLWDVTAKSGANGEYRVDNLSPNYTYTVRATLPIKDTPPTSKNSEGLAAYVRTQKEQEHGLATMIYSRLPNSGLAGQTGVQVHPGQVTRVDLQVDSEETKTALIYGEVTDPETGAPVCPVCIQAFWHEGVASDTFLAGTTTDTDGSYELPLYSVNRKEKVWIVAGWDDTKPVASVEADPEIPKELNLSVLSPITVTVRCVDEEGNPLTGVEINVSTRSTTDEDGRATVYGLAPYVSHTLAAYERSEQYNLTCIGISEPFSGKPGEDLSDIIIPCTHAFGSISGQIVIPLEAEEFMRSRSCFVSFYYGETSSALPMNAPLDSSNRFSLESVKPGNCRIRLFLATWRTQTPLQWWAIIDNVKIKAGQTTDLGLISLIVSEWM